MIFFSSQNSLHDAEEFFRHVVLAEAVFEGEIKSVVIECFQALPRLLRTLQRPTAPINIYVDVFLQVLCHSAKLVNIYVDVLQLKYKARYSNILILSFTKDTEGMYSKIP